jgi:integrase
MAKPLKLYRWIKNPDGTTAKAWTGKWRIRWLDFEGKPASEVFERESEAKAALRQRLVERDKIRAGTAQPKSNLTLREVAAEWLKTRAPDRKREDESHLRVHILPVLGDVKMPKIRDEIAAFIRHLESKTTACPRWKTQRPLSAASIQRNLCTLRKCLNDNGYGLRIPYKVQLPAPAWIKNVDDVGRFLNGCSPSWFHVAAAIAVYAGARKGEVAGLLKSAVDFEHAMIRIDRTYDGKPTKTKHARFVPLAPELAAILKTWFLRCPGQLAVTIHGRPIRKKTQTARYTRAACKRTGVAPVNFHQLRHTAASHLALRNALPVVGAVLGHACPQTTARYMHLDSASVARSTSVHLSFARPEGKVVPFPGKLDQAGESRHDSDRTGHNVDTPKAAAGADVASS